MAAAFALAAALQYNDADALRWVSIYGVASALCGVAAWRGRAPLPAALSLAAVSAVWALVLVRRLPGLHVYGHMFDSWRMRAAGVEEARESLGLLLVAACAISIAAASARGRGTRRHRAH